MKLEDRDPNERKGARIEWGGAYMFVGIAISYWAFRSWHLIHLQPFNWSDAINAGIYLVVCLVPLYAGLAFRKLLKSDLNEDLLSARTYQICDSQIAQMLALSYLAIVIFEH
jgi:hypothetical protein